MYEGMAVAKEGIAGQLGANLTGPGIEAASDALGPNRTLALKRHLFVRVFDGIEKHSAWSSGFGLCSPSAALRSDFVIAGQTDEHFAREISRVFEYDDVITTNPPGASIPHRSCRQKNYGVC